MGIRGRLRAVKTWLTEERVILFSAGGEGNNVTVYDGVPRWKRLLHVPGKWVWRERDWLIKAILAAIFTAAIGGIGVLIGKYWLK